MTRKVMGTPEASVDVNEAAKILGCTTRTLLRLSSQGLLRPTWKGKRKFFLRDDLLAFGKVFNGKTDWSSIAALAMRAFVKAETNERRLSEICDVLGLGTYVLETEPEDIYAFYEDAKKRLKDSPPVLAPEAMLLARKLLGLTEEYLLLAENITEDPEPWRPFLELVGHLCTNAPRTYFQSDPELASAYGFLEAARRHVRPLAYFYVRRQHGMRLANQAFDMRDDYASPILRTLFAH